MASAVPLALGPARAFDADFWSRRDARSRARFVLALVLGLVWMVFSIWLSLPWLSDLAQLSHPVVALLVLTFVAYVPGFMNAFLMASLVMRPDPVRAEPQHWPAISILIAAYQEEALIGETLRSIAGLDYPGELEIFVLDDGSTDRTADEVRPWLPVFDALPHRQAILVSEPENRGKARVLNHGLELASHDLVITIDADTLMEPGCITALVEHLAACPPDTKAIAGAVLVRNHAESWITRAQQWDYFHGIAAVKRMQGMYNGTLVAQGAFSIYEKQALVEAGGWPDTVGEDIVLTWSLLKAGHRTGFAEDAVAWTHAPETLGTLARQRKRWARGMIEALSIHTRLLSAWRMRTMFIWWNLLFVSIDLAFTLAFIPGLILALFGIFWLAGPITLLVLPLAGLWNIVIYRIQTRMLKRNNIDMEKSLWGFVLYAFVYPFLMQPVSVWGYVSELTGGRKQWN